MIEEIHDVCAIIGSFCDANGNFQRQVAFDLRDKDKNKITLMEMAETIQAASDRYNRMHGKKISEMETRDVNWGFRYGRWGHTIEDTWRTRGQDDARG